ncbi:MAG: chemotaxis protein CheB, partial [Thermomicrobiales bacterium]
MDSETDSSQPVDQLIVVGSSAGGVEALSVLVGSLPAGLPASFVVAQHLDPSRPSHLGEILGRRSIMPVITVSDCENLLPGNIYIVPSNRHVEITDHEVRVHADATRRPTPSIDLLLATAAKMFGERLVALILTGSGSDGAAGAHAVKEAGGTVIIQDPATAAFPSMPRALASPLVDATIPLDDIGAFLVSFLTQPAETESETADDQLSTLLERLRDRRGIDFAAYKSPTIERRLRRRMAVVGVDTLGDYLVHVDEHPDEEERLVGSFLIKV